MSTDLSLYAFLDSCVFKTLECCIFFLHNRIHISIEIPLAMSSRIRRVVLPYSLINGKGRPRAPKLTTPLFHLTRILDSPHLTIQRRYNSEKNVFPPVEAVAASPADPSLSIPVSTPQNSSSEAEISEPDPIYDDVLNTVSTEPLVLFLKGSPDEARCGYSKRVVDILDAIQVEYVAFNALAHPSVPKGARKLSQWHTFPQLFIHGEFVGGTDVIMEIARNGQLYEALDKHKIKYHKVNFS